MASQDQIRQFSHAIPPSQPNRSLSRTPRRDSCNWPAPSLTMFPGPFIKQRLCHDLCGVHRRHGHSILVMVVSKLKLLVNILQCFRRATPFPPQPPQHPPPSPTPPPGCPATPHQHYTTTPGSPSGISPSTQTTSPAGRGYIIRPGEIPPVDTWKPDPEFLNTGKVHPVQRHRGHGSAPGSCTRAYTTSGYEELPMFVKPMSSRLTTLGPRSLWLNSSASFVPQY